MNKAGARVPEKQNEVPDPILIRSPLDSAMFMVKNEFFSGLLASQGRPPALPGRQ